MTTNPERVDDRRHRGRPEIGVGAVVVRDGALLMIRRGRPPAAGSWSVPGGRVERGETLEAALAREVAEECGIEIRCRRFLGWVERIAPDRHDVIIDFVAEQVGDDPIRAGDDAVDARWVPLPEVERLDLVPGLGAFLREHGVLGEGNGLPGASGEPVRSPT